MILIGIVGLGFIIGVPYLLENSTLFYFPFDRTLVS